MPVEINAGSLRHRVDIEELDVATAGSRGQAGTTWIKWKRKIPCSIVPLSGTELELANQIEATITHKVVIRWVSGVTPQMRLNYCGRYLYIRQVINVEERNRRLELFCGEEK